MEPFEPKKLPSQIGKKVQVSPAVKTGFMPFLAAFSQGDPNIVTAEPSVVPPHDHLESKLEFVKEEGVIKKILVHCSCGKVTEIVCFYEEEN